jgi:glucose-1-phosphate cytidylyltransferase
MLETLPMQNLIKINKLASYQHNGFWQCIDNRRDLETIKKLIKTRNAPWIKKI